MYTLIGSSPSLEFVCVWGGGGGGGDMSSHCIGLETCGSMRLWPGLFVNTGISQLQITAKRKLG